MEDQTAVEGKNEEPATPPTDSDEEQASDVSGASAEEPPASAVTPSEATGEPTRPLPPSLGGPTQGSEILESEPSAEPAATPPEKEQVNEQVQEHPPEPAESLAGLPRNTIGGHLFLAVRGGLAAPFGKIARNTQHLDYAGIGWGLGADLGVGVGRNVVLGVYGDLLALGDGEECRGCDPQSLGGGIFVRYHLVQGLSFDPWASYGIGVRTLSFGSGAQSQDYVGLEWLRVTFGGDFYPSKYLGFGPYMELGAGSFLAVPDGERAGGVDYRFQTGLRISVDFMGR